MEVLIERVEIRSDGIRLSVKLPIAAAEAGCHPAELAPSRLVPLQIRRRWIELKFAVNGDAKASARTDPALLKMIARTHCWLDEMVSGRAASMPKIGKRERVGKRYVSLVIRFAFLSPETVEQIVTGYQPPELTAELLLRRHSQLPLARKSQHRVLGFPLPA